MGRKRIAGSLIGGIKETQRDVRISVVNNTSDIELINIQDINTAYDRVTNNDVKIQICDMMLK
jgi:uncharacterized zinc-type alcohol dehydrogenase-like protein